MLHPSHSGPTAHESSKFSESAEELIWRRKPIHVLNHAHKGMAIRPQMYACVPLEDNSHRQ